MQGKSSIRGSVKKVERGREALIGDDLSMEE